MRCSSFLVSLAFLTVSTTLASAAPQGPAVAVFPIQVIDVPQLRDSNPDKFLDLLEAMVIAERFPTIPRSDIKAVINDTSAQSFKDCYDESCQIELGKAVAARKALYSSFASFGRRCRLIIKLYDLESELAESSSSQTTSCDEEGLARAIEDARTELGRSVEPGQTVAPLPKPAPAKAPPPPTAAIPTAAPNADEPQTESDGGSDLWWVWLIGGVVAVGAGVAVAVVVSQGGSNTSGTTIADAGLPTAFRF